MSAAVKESFLERYWQVFVIGLGIVLTGFFALYNPLVPGEPHTPHADPVIINEKPPIVIRSGGV